jgi:hypothetical protein
VNKLVRLHQLTIVGYGLNAVVYARIVRRSNSQGASKFQAQEAFTKVLGSVFVPNFLQMEYAVHSAEEHMEHAAQVDERPLT